MVKAALDHPEAPRPAPRRAGLEELGTMPAPGDEELGKLKQRRYEEVGLDRKAKYRALAKLKEAGLVSTRRVGNQSIEVTLLHTNGLIPGYEE